MSRWIVALLVVATGLCLVLYKLFVPRSPSTIQVAIGDAALTPEVTPADAAPHRPRRPGSDAQLVPSNARGSSEQLDPQSEEFSREIDVGIPDRFRASLARCSREGFDPDAKISLSYTLTIKDGVVSASNVQIESSDLGDSNLENCMVRSIEGLRFTAPKLPDFSEDQDLFLRIRSLDKYLDEDEQRAAKKRASSENN